MKLMSKHVMQFGISVNYKCTSDQMGQLMIQQYLWHMRMRPLYTPMLTYQAGLRIFVLSDFVFCLI